MQHIKTPLDLISLTCITPADAQQAIDTAYPFDKQGFILWSDTAPDVVTDPVLSYFLWGKTTAGVKPVDVADLEISYYNGTSWQLIPFNILEGSVTLDDISLAGSTPKYIIQVNAGGTALIWTSIITAIDLNTLPPNRLLLPNNTDTFILAAFAGATDFYELTAFFIAIADNVIPVTKLIKGAADPLKQVLTTKVDGSAIEWAAMDVVNIGAAGSAAAQSIRRNAGNTAWEYYPANTGILALTNGGVYWAVPGSGAVQQIPHTLAAIPSNVRVVLRCATAVDGYSIGDELEIFSVTADIDGTNQGNAFGVVSDSINITVIATGFATGIFYTAKTGGGNTGFDGSKWKLKAYVVA